MSKFITNLKALLGRLFVVAGAVVLTLLFFLVLLLMQKISEGNQSTMLTQDIGAALPPPPSPPPPEDEPEEEEPEEEPPQLVEEVQPLDFSQLEAALNIGSGVGYGVADFQLDLSQVAGGSQSLDELFSASELDQKPRAIYQEGPRITSAMRRKLFKQPSTVYVIFIVNKKGRVENPKAQRPGDPTFDQAAVNAVKKWKFEPGRRSGDAVRFRMRVPITFPKVGS